MKMRIVFTLAESAAHAESGDVSLHMVTMEVPQEVIERCAEKYLAIKLQHKLRTGYGEWGKLDIFGHRLEFEALRVEPELVKKARDAVKRMKSESDE